MNRRHAPARAFTAASLLAVLFSVGPITSAQGEDSVSPVAGELLPVRPAAAMTGEGVTSASSTYGLHKNLQYDEQRGVAVGIVRLSDGAEVRDIPDYPSVRREQQPHVEGDNVVMVLGSSVGGRGTLDVTDAETGDPAGADGLEIGDHDFVVHADDEWAMVDDLGSDTTQHFVTVIRPGGDVRVNKVFTDDPRWVGGDSDAAFVTVDGFSYAIDTATGGVDRLPLPADAEIMGVTDETVVARRDSIVNANWLSTVIVLDRASGAVTAQTVVPRNDGDRTFLPYRDGAALVSYAGGGDADHLQVLPVDFADGGTDAPIATSVSTARSTLDGGLVLTVADVPTGRIVVAAADGSIRNVGDLPTTFRRVSSLALSEGLVAASWQGSPGVWTTRLGAAAWQEVSPVPDFADDLNSPFWFSRGVLAWPATGPGGVNPPRFTLAWPGGSRSVSTWGFGFGRGGRYVAVSVGSGTEVQEVRTGNVRATYPSGPLPVIDGGWAWTGPDAQGLLTGRDLTESGADRIVDVSESCPLRSDLADIRGRWAMLECGGAVRVVDLLDTTEQLDLPTPQATLGNGFAAWIDRVPSQTGIDEVRLDVADLTNGETRVYGLLRGHVTPPGIDFAVDDGETRRLVYADSSSLPRVVDLSWVDDPAPVNDPDLTAPVMTDAPVLEEVVASLAPVSRSVGWSFSDDAPFWEQRSGVASVDVRMRSTDMWTYPEAWQGLPPVTASRLETTLPAGHTTCFSARARDLAGNETPWSPEVCQHVDDSSPQLQNVGGSPGFPPSVRDEVTFTAHALDDDRVASYDVDRRTASLGGPLGPWSGAVSDGPDVSVSSGVMGPGTETCYRVRARDRVGNTSEWSPAHCSTLSVDDKSMVRHGRTTRAATSRAIGGGVTELRAKGASVTLARQTGRVVGLWLLRAPRSGVADVFVDGRRLARVSGTAPTTRRVLLQLPAAHVFSGAVKVVAASARPVRVDAVAVAR